MRKCDRDFCSYYNKGKCILFKEKDIDIPEDCQYELTPYSKEQYVYNIIKYRLSHNETFKEMYIKVLDGDADI